jgi:hypothetical protein
MATIQNDASFCDFNTYRVIPAADRFASCAAQRV